MPGRGDVICAWDPELNAYCEFVIIGEHGPYFVCESTVTGRQILILKGEIWRYTDMTPCRKGYGR